MSTTIMSHSSRKLPSLDWIAFGLGVVGLMLSRVPGPGWGTWVGLLGLAIFGPPFLREVGVINDEDEYTRRIRWRAGFHAALVVGLLVFLNKVLYPLIGSHPVAMVRKVGFFPVDFIRQILILTFLFSYLIQYWGAPKGVFRLLLGIAGLALVETIMKLVRHNQDQGIILLSMLGIVSLIVGAAFFTRWRPKLGGYLLLLVGMFFLVLEIRTMTIGFPEEALDMRLRLIQSATVFLMVFGTTGISLLKSDPEEKE